MDQKGITPLLVEILDKLWIKTVCIAQVFLESSVSQVYIYCFYPQFSCYYYYDYCII